MKENLYLKSITMLQTLYGKKLDKGIISLYWKRLKDYTDIQFGEMINYLIDNFKPTSQNPFPLIPDFLKGIGEDENTKAQNIISEVKKASHIIGNYRSINFGDRALHATIERFGGWTIISMWSEEEWRFQSKNFMDSYKAALKNRETGSQYLIGQHEYENRIKGYKNDSIKKWPLKWSRFEQIEYKKQNKLKIKSKEPSLIGDIIDISIR